MNGINSHSHKSEKRLGVSAAIGSKALGCVKSVKRGAEGIQSAVKSYRRNGQRFKLTGIFVYGFFKFTDFIGANGQSAAILCPSELNKRI